MINLHTEIETPVPNLVPDLVHMTGSLAVFSYVDPNNVPMDNLSFQNARICRIACGKGVLND